METYTFRYKNFVRELPVYEVKEGLKIAYLDTLSDYGLVTALSEEMAQLLCGNEAVLCAERVVLFTAENKGVPFAYAVVHALQQKFNGKTVELAIARKQKKKFFGACLETQKSSITTEAKEERLFLPESDCKKLQNAAVVLVDDFYSTGASMNALETLANKCGAKVLDKIVAVWERGNEQDKPNVKYVTTLPVL